MDKKLYAEYLSSLNYFKGIFKKSFLSRNKEVLQDINEVLNQLQKPETYQWDKKIDLHSNYKDNFNTISGLILDLPSDRFLESELSSKRKGYIEHRKTLFTVFLEYGLKDYLNKYDSKSNTTFVEYLHKVDSKLLKLFLDNGLKLRAMQDFGTQNFIKTSCFKQDGGYTTNLSAAYSSKPGTRLDQYQDYVEKLKIIYQDLLKDNLDNEYLEFCIRHTCVQFLNQMDFENFKIFVDTFKIDLDTPFQYESFISCSLKEVACHKEFSTTYQYLNFLRENNYLDLQQTKELIEKIKKYQSLTQENQLRLIALENDNLQKVKIL